MTDNTMTLTIHMRADSRWEITVDETTKQITHYFTHPNPAKLIAVPDDLAAPFVNLALHQIDLRRARAFLDEIGSQGGVQPGQEMSTVCMALWLAALAATMKCFQHSASRTKKLDADTILEPIQPNPCEPRSIC